ncbi:hypothetical protein [Halalkalirubrum salinum]|uniref:hypothetical protein n=1 Tax=Halalkalirubrum salinum TaxID=2563889 RepID=UPI0010FB6DAD|nr:hypothetical protein [Halalkalirubrum salinum]
MIVVATSDFKLYHEAVTALRERGVAFTTVAPAKIDTGDELPERTTVVLTTREDRIDLGGHHDIELVYGDAERIRPAIEEALSILRGGDDRLIIGVDPGTRPGIVVTLGGTVTAAFQVPLAAAVDRIREEVEDAADPLVRIGDGARLQGAQIVNDLPDVAVELVDETGTTPYLGAGARGMGDVLAATNIARLEGERIDSIEIDPTDGELQRIKNESRRRSAGGRTISEPLARRVAHGELTVDEALSAHESESDSESHEGESRDVSAGAEGDRDDRADRGSDRNADETQ